MSALENYRDLVLNQFESVFHSQRDLLDRIATVLADALVHHHFLYAFGTGHSHLLAEEVFYRAGGLARAAALLDPPLMLHQSASASSLLEQESGRAAALLDRYPIQPGDVLLIASNSGRNAVPIEMALTARARGLTTVAITSLAHSRAFPSRHPSGQRLFEVADLVLDNGAVPGDAALHIDGLTPAIGPTSTLTGVFLVNLLVVRAIELATAAGSPPEVYASSNAGQPSWNDSLLATYRPRIRHL